MSAPSDILAHFSTSRYPHIWELADTMREVKLSGEGNWPDNIFLPVAGWYSVTCGILDKERLDLADAGILTALSAAGAWRYTQDIVRFDDALFDAIINTDIDDTMPDEVVEHLPAWCVYIETQRDLEAFIEPSDGFFAFLEEDYNTKVRELRLLFHMAGEDASAPSSWVPWTLHLGCGSIKQGVVDMLATSVRNLSTLNETDRERAQIVRAIREPHLNTKGIHRAINLVLYICAYGLSERRADGYTAPHYPSEKRIKGGWKLFPAQKPTMRYVGQDIGAALRQAMESADTEPRQTEGHHASPRPHIRRGHWHGYWSGPKKGNRQFDLHWLPPIPVALR